MVRLSLVDTVCRTCSAVQGQLYHLLFPPRRPREQPRPRVLLLLPSSPPLELDNALDAPQPLDLVHLVDDADARPQRRREADVGERERRARAAEVEQGRAREAEREEVRGREMGERGVERCTCE